MEKHLLNTIDAEVIWERLAEVRRSAQQAAELMRRSDGHEYY